MGPANGDKTEHVRRSSIFKADPGHGMNAHVCVLDVCESGSSLKCFLLPCCVCFLSTPTHASVVLLVSVCCYVVVVLLLLIPSLHYGVV